MSFVVPAEVVEADWSLQKASYRHRNTAADRHAVAEVFPVELPQVLQNFALLAVLPLRAPEADQNDAQETGLQESLEQIKEKVHGLDSPVWPYPRCDVAATHG